MAALHKPVTASTIVKSTSTDVYGYSFKATAESEVILRDGEDATGTGVIFIYLLEGQSVVNYLDHGVPFQKGVYAHVVSGTVTGSVWV